MSAPLWKAAPGADLYERDYFDWTVQQAQLLRRLRPKELDWENVAEEIESLGPSDKRKITANLAAVLLHLLKWRYQPDRRKSGWKSSTIEHRRRLTELLDDSPSLRSFPGEVLSDEYGFARGRAVDETGWPESGFPETCPFTIEQVLDRDFWPE